MYGAVTVRQETVTLPTWTTGAEDPNPMFLENRVYQGSSGAVYPYGVIDTLTGKREMRDYQAVWIENDFIRVMLLPELGGRIHRAYDKVMERDFVYYNEVVKPALVGLVGPWISGGIEFNWPQHHRPTTFMAVDVTFQQRENGAQTVWLGEVEPMRGLQVMTGFTLYPDKALIEITGKVFNGNATPRHFLWWANPAVKGGDDHQSVFPPDVTAVFDHGKRDVSAFPIAQGTYYKVDYSAGVDISRYKNIPVPTSYMADKSEYDFVGAYHHGEKGGLLHIADHHVSPGKKQWTWGNCDFGLAWDRNLTDSNGPYIELMTGVFTDNQPDFTWLAPYEEKVFVQNFLPYSQLGTLQNANTRAAVKLERHSGQLQLGVYAITPLSETTLELEAEGKTIWQRALSLQPAQAWQENVQDSWPQRLTLHLRDAQGRIILSYCEHVAAELPLPQPASVPARPQDIDNCDELYFIGQHLEQYLHASRSAFDYYQRALALDPQDYRCNVALGTLEFNRGNWTLAEKLADAALKRGHRLNKNPQNGDASMLRAGAKERQGDDRGAFDDYFKASWSGNCRDAAYYNLARLAMRKGDALQALAFVSQSLKFNASNNLAMGLKALALCQTGATSQALAWISQQLEEYPLSYALHYARWAITQSPADRAELLRVTGQRGENASILAGWLVGMGAEAAAKAMLTALDSQEAMPLLWQAALAEGEVRQQFLTLAQQRFAAKVRFPNTLDEVQMLQRLPQDGFAQYLLGCFWYSKRRYHEAVECWMFTVKQLPDFGPVQRVLGIHSWNKKHDAQLAERYLQRAVELEPDNARFLFELDYLQKLTARTTEQRLELLASRRDVVLKRDDLTAELLSLWNIHGQTEAAAQVLSERKFHPWEGGEGKITGQYLINLQRRALKCIADKQYVQAETLLNQALSYPDNLGEGRLVGQSDNDIWYLLGWCATQRQDFERAQACFSRALEGGSTLEAGRYYNDQPVDYLFYQAMALARSGEVVEAGQQFRNFLSWADDHRNDRVEPDFFAVSLPDLVALDADLQAKHQQHCLFVAALGHLGLGQLTEFETVIKALLLQNPAHDKAHLLRLAAQHGVFA
jgi:tetratricopeptide (TPR) repeat protein